MIDYEWDVGKTDEYKDEIFRTITFVQERFGKTMDVEVLITSGEKIRLLNRDYRNIDKTTDVLSFPNFEGGPKDVTSGYLGSIAVSFDRAACQAEEYGHTLLREMCFLCTHGMLHLLGYDHVEPEDEKVMKELAKTILEELQIRRS